MSRFVRLGVVIAVSILTWWGCGSCSPSQRRADVVETPVPEREVPERTSRRGPLAIRVAELTSSSVTLTWEVPDGAEELIVSLGSEPPDDEGTLASSVVLGRVPATETRFVASGLAASTDAFLRVEARGASSWGVAHARTLGGPRTALDSPLREVHAHGPSVLELVLENRDVRFADGRLEGDRGAQWQGGTWRVERSDGSDVSVRRVHRRTLPVAQPGYEVGFERYGDGSVLVIDHSIFLVLGEPLGDRDVLRVRHEGEPLLDVRVPWSDRYLETPFIQVNQVGYDPDARARFAYVSGWMGDGGPVSLDRLSATAEVVSEPLDAMEPRRVAASGLALRQRAARDDDSGGAVREIDLSSVPAADGVRYRVRVPGVGVSFPTAVSDEAVLRAYFTVARGLYLNRWCGDLDAEHTDWSRPRDHCTAFFVTGRRFRDGMFPESTPRTGERRVEGGHHDAGDFDIRAFHVTVAQYLMRAYELEPARFPDGQLGVPESGNRIPDLLDEALYSIAAWEALQNDDGSVRSGVESHRHPAGVYLANEDRLPYWTFDPMPWHTMYVAALFAQGAFLVRSFDAAKSRALAERAQKAWRWASSRQPPPAYRLYAASELFRLTGDARYGDEVKRVWRSLDRYGRGAFDAVVPMPKIYDGAFDDYSPVMADFVMGYATTEGADPEIVATTRRCVIEMADRQASAILDSPHAHRNGRPTDEPRTWGQSTTTGRHADGIYHALQLGELADDARQRYVDAISVAADYALGANPASYVWITGLGSRSPREALHLDSLVFVRRGMPPVPGIPVFGPVEEVPGADWYMPIRASFHPAYDRTPGGRRISDTHASVNMNEFAVWTQQAPMALLFAASVGRDAVPESWRAGRPMHRDTLAAHTRDAPLAAAPEAAPAPAPTAPSSPRP